MPVLIPDAMPVGAKVMDTIKFMPEHYPKNTVTASVWCKVCGRETTHRIDDGRRGPCMECMHQRELEVVKKPPAKQEGLFK